MAVKRKCPVCGKTEQITRQNVHDFILHQAQYYHSACFDQLCADKVANSRTKKRWEGIYTQKEELQKSAEKVLVLAIEKDDVDAFIHNKYDTTFIGSTVYQKLADIYAGTWKGMSCGISPRVLLDMWNYYWEGILKVHQRNNKYGKTMDTDSQVKYDLSILLGKYSEYKGIIDKQAAEAALRANETKSAKINYDDLSKRNQSNGNEPSTLDMFNEIFG